LLAALNSTSKVAVWRLLAYIHAVAIHTHEVLFDLFKSEVQAVADSAYTGTARWYQSAIFAYQHGDSLVYDTTNRKYKYATENTAVQIVKRAAIIEGADGVLTIKVAKLAGSPAAPIALTSPEQTALAAYISKIRFAGTRYVLVSGNGDILKIVGNIYYDGSIEVATVRASVEAAINAYIGGLPFNGQFLTNALIDAIQSVTGVNDVLLTSVQSKPLAAGTYADVVRTTVPDYGYFNISTDAGETLTDTLTYLAQ
jgi:hypothetical protein